jgi:tetratricopeptide (TPR) repeat protein
MKMYNEAVEEYNVALTISPLEYKAHFDLGMAYRDQGNYSNAASSFEKSLQINSSQIDPHEELGMIYYRNLKDNQKAVFHFEKVLAMNPNHRDADKIKSIINLIKGK